MQGSFTPDSAEKFFQMMKDEGYDVNAPVVGAERVNFSTQGVKEECQVGGSWSGNVADFGEVRGEYIDVVDFTRCVKPDGSAYGTSGTCKKGTPQELDEDDEAKVVGQLSKLIPKGESILGRYGKVYKS